MLVRQFRPAISSYTLELPAGYVDRRESPWKAVRRELSEETGYACSAVKYVGCLKVAPERVNSRVHVFFGKGARVINGAIRDGGVEVILVTERELRKMITRGDFAAVSGLAIYFLLKYKGVF